DIILALLHNQSKILSAPPRGFSKRLYRLSLKVNTIVASSAFVYTNAVFADRFFYGSTKCLLGTSQTLMHPV
ncbi:MAG: hypothetical protein ACI4JC_04320, partial [Faecalibacterium sp.]